MRNPKWHRDEIILALDLYFDKDRGPVDKKNPKIIEASALINKLPIFDYRPDESTFRNPNGIALKLSNFMAVDPDYKGKGMSSTSKLDKEVFDEFYNDRARLKTIATEIKSVISNDVLSKAVKTVESEDEEDDIVEGQVLFRMHKVRERNTKLVIQKKRTVFEQSGKLECEACLFDFSKQYGDLGFGYIECHHITPLSQFKTASKTRIDDLALVCSNCHRMLHRNISSLTILELKTLIAKQPQ